jgi:hypothetical protein
MKRARRTEKLVVASGGASAWRYIGNRIIAQVNKNDEDKERLKKENARMKRVLLELVDDPDADMIVRCKYCEGFETTEYMSCDACGKHVCGSCEPGGELTVVRCRECNHRHEVCMECAPGSLHHCFWCKTIMNV